MKTIIKKFKLKKGFLFLSFFLLYFITQAQNSILIFGKVLNSKSDKVYIQHINDYLSFNRTIVDSAFIDKNGNFSMTFKWKKFDRAYLEIGKESTDLFLTPNDSLKITVNCEQFDESIIYTGRGASVNNYYAKKLKINSTLVKAKMAASKAMNEERYSYYIDSIYNNDKVIFNNYFSKINNKPKSVTDFMLYEANEITYLWIRDKLEYPLFHSYFNNLKEPLEMRENYYDFLKQINFNNPNSINSFNFLHTIHLFTNYYLKKEMKKDSTLKNKIHYAEAHEAFIEKTFTNELRDLLLAKMAYNLIVHENNIDLGKKILDKYSLTSKTKEYVEILNTFYALAARLTPGKPAIEFAYADINGKTVSLKDFRGQVVYLDFWASWCGPCVKEIPAAKKLEEEMQGKNVVFLCVSLDNDENVWKKTVKEKEMTGIHLICKGGFKSEIAKMYNVNGIPKYIIIDQNGNIVNCNANRPSANVKADIEKLLK